MDEDSSLFDTGDDFEAEVTQLAFAEEYVKYRDIGKAWCKATGKLLTPDGKAEALRWFKNPAIQQLIIDAESKTRRLAEITREDHMVKLGEIRDEANFHGKFGVALAAEKARGTVAGFYRQKDNKTLDDMKDVTALTTHEIRKRLAQSESGRGSVVEGALAPPRSSTET